MNKGQGRDELWLEDGEKVIEGDAFTDLLDSAYSREPAEHDMKRALTRVESALAELSGGKLYYDVLSSTPFGPIYIAVSEEGITALGFDDSEEEFVARMHKRHGSSIERSWAYVAPVVEQLKGYFDGERETFDIPLDLRSLTPFQHAVLAAIQQIPPGETISYGGLAHRIGKPGSARAVGRALGSNPIPIIIPCHRALAADGSLGGYSGRGGVRTKQALLTLEGAWG